MMKIFVISPVAILSILLVNSIRKSVFMTMTGTVGMNTWHRFGLISKYEFDKFMKNCTNPEQVVY